MTSNIDKELITTAKSYLKNRTTTMKGVEQKSDTTRYVDNERFQLEMNTVFKKLPSILLHASELAIPNTFTSVEHAMGNLIVSRDDRGIVHVFYNSCRHRGAKLVSSKACKKSITCPYHAWSYSTDGKLLNLPGHQQCFPTLEKSDNGLLEIPSLEKHGFIWICPNVNEASEYVKSIGTHVDNKSAELALDSHLGSMAEQLAWVAPQKRKAFKSTRKIWNANWKIFIEGGLETYHFMFAHKNTIAPYFHNNTAVIDQFDHQFRVFMPTRVLTHKDSPDEDNMSIHDCSHTLFTALPNAVLLVQKELIDLIHFRPITADQTEITVTTLVPDEADLDDPAQFAHWQRNHNITNETLDEDWALGVTIQESISMGALPYIQYGKNEWALHAFNQMLDELLTTT